MGSHRLSAKRIAELDANAAKWAAEFYNEEIEVAVRGENRTVKAHIDREDPSRPWAKCHATVLVQFPYGTKTHVQGLTVALTNGAWKPCYGDQLSWRTHAPTVLGWAENKEAQPHT